ncbi:MAG TPA: ATP-binding protein [Vicinamibacteria bacterium]|nr:ATP-binding protein [Vicinamibacteria bacterium]
MSARRAALVLRVPSRTEFLAAIRDVTRRMAETAGFDAAQADQLALAVDEASTNVIEHAYRGAADRRIELRFHDRGGELRVEVADDGQAVDPREIPEVDLRRYASERRTGGLGMHLMGRIMDSVTFRRDGGGNVCCMVKRKPERREASG